MLAFLALTRGIRASTFYIFSSQLGIPSHVEQYSHIGDTKDFSMVFVMQYPEPNLVPP